MEFTSSSSRKLLIASHGKHGAVDSPALQGLVGVRRRKRDNREAQSLADRNAGAGDAQFERPHFLKRPGGLGCVDRERAGRERVHQSRAVGEFLVGELVFRVPFPQNGAAHRRARTQ